MADNVTRLQNIKAKIETGKTEVTKATTNLETYTKQREEIAGQIEALGVKPEGLDAEIEALHPDAGARHTQRFRRRPLGSQPGLPGRQRPRRHHVIRSNGSGPTRTQRASISAAHCALVHGPAHRL